MIDVEPEPTEFDHHMERYAIRAMDIEIHHVVAGKRTVAAEPGPGVVAKAVLEALQGRR